VKAVVIRARARTRARIKIRKKTIRLDSKCFGHIMCIYIRSTMQHVL